MTRQARSKAATCRLSFGPPRGPAPLILSFLISNTLEGGTRVTGTSRVTAAPGLRSIRPTVNAIMTWAARRQDRRSPLSRGSRGSCISPANCRTERLVARVAWQSADNLARRMSLFPEPYNVAMRKLLQPHG
jgi:hypothetical protein